jgi:hypothetical protein
VETKTILERFYCVMGRNMKMYEEIRYLEKLHEPIFINVVWWLELDAIKALEIGLKSTNRLMRQLYNDNIFWKLQFEDVIERTFPPN